MEKLKYTITVVVHRIFALMKYTTYRIKDKLQYKHCSAVIINTVLCLFMIVLNIASNAVIIFAAEPDSQSESSKFQIEKYYATLLDAANEPEPIKETIRQKEDAPIEAAEKSETFTDVGVCAYSDTKTYEDGSAITDRTSAQYWLLQDMHIDERGFYVTSDGYIGVALGSYYGAIGTKYKVTLDSGIELRVIKADEKADKDVNNGCWHKSDGSILEFIIDSYTAEQYFGRAPNGYINSGNYNNHEQFAGTIVKFEKLI